jgi:ATP-dependent RNA helicase RhlE
MSFESLGLMPELVRAITERGYTSATAVQSRAIPEILAGHDVLAGAQTGTGKTAGFALPILQRLHIGHRGKSPRALVLVPTRELAAQVADSIRLYSKYLPLRTVTIFGGVNINPQIDALARGLDICVATPGRLLDHVQQGNVDLEHVETFVLDEADRMLDMGFIHDLKRIMKQLPTKRQNLMFSATYSDDIRRLAQSFLRSPIEIEVARRNTAVEAVDQFAFMVQKNDKRALLSHLIRHNDWPQVLVFTRTKHGANRLAKQLYEDGIDTAAIHGNKSQNARTQALAGFKLGKVRALVATEVAARGLDIKELPYVVNYELPNVPEDYVHRIGRTGRAGATGVAVSLVAHDETGLLKDIERTIGRQVTRQPLPEVSAPAVRRSPQPEAPQSQHAGRSSQPSRQRDNRGQQRGGQDSHGSSRPQGGNGNGNRPQRAHSQRSHQGRPQQGRSSQQRSGQ